MPLHLHESLWCVLEIGHGCNRGVVVCVLHVVYHRRWPVFSTDWNVHFIHGKTFDFEKMIGRIDVVGMHDVFKSSS